MDSFSQDLRYALRRILKSPGFTVVSVITLALGIGANSAIFSVVNGVLLKPLPFKDPDRLVAIYHVSEGRRSTVSGPNFTDLRRLSETLADMTLLAIFAGVALLLAAIGIFGVLSYAVAQRTREIGIRMALGARERMVIGLVVRHAMILACAGVVLGVAAAYFLSTTLSTLLYSTQLRDPLTFASVAGLLLLVALFASYVPARRATKVDPIVALRAE